MTTYVDTCVLIDAIDEDADHHQWSVDRLNEAKEVGPVFVSDAVYSEFSVAMDSVDEVNQVLTVLNLQRCSYSEHDLFDAGKAFLAYRQNQGTKSNVLPDFFIGALARNNAKPLITRDVQRFATYFPEAELVIP